MGIVRTLCNIHTYGHICTITLVHTSQKNTDTFASAFGFFLIGCDFVAGVVADDYPVVRAPFQVQEPLLWFFKVWKFCSD